MPEPGHFVAARGVLALALASSSVAASQGLAADRPDTRVAITEPAPTPNLGQVAPAGERSTDVESTGDLLPTLATDLVVSAGTPLRVALDERTRVQRVGQPVTATLIEPVYANDRIVVPAGAKVLGHVAQLVGASKATLVVGALHGNLSPPRHVVLEFDGMILDGGLRLAIKTRVGPGMADVVMQTAGESHKTSVVERAREEIAKRTKETLAPLKEPRKIEHLKDYLVGKLPYHPQYLAEGMVFDAELLCPLDLGPARPIPRAAAGTPLPPDGILATRLLTEIDSGTTPRGTLVRAVVTQPVLSADKKVILPEGTELTGEVTFSKPAGKLHRNGQLRFLFESVQIPDQASETLLASLYSAETSESDRLKIDEEGGASVTNSKSRFVAPALALVALHAAAGHDRGVDEDGDNVGRSMTGVEHGSGGGQGWAGFSGMGILGIGLSQISRPVAVALGFVGFARRLYGNVLGKGKEVSFPAGTRMQVQLASNAPQKK